MRRALPILLLCASVAQASPGPAPLPDLAGWRRIERTEERLVSRVDDGRAILCVHRYRLEDGSIVLVRSRYDPPPEKPREDAPPEAQRAYRDIFNHQLEWVGEEDHQAEEAARRAALRRPAAPAIVIERDLLRGAAPR